MLIVQASVTNMTYKAQIDLPPPISITLNFQTHQFLFCLRACVFPIPSAWNAFPTLLGWLTLINNSGISLN